MTERTCGDCGECCVDVLIEDKSIGFYKAATTPCPHLDAKGWGCNVFGTGFRPKSCSDYLCSWMRGSGSDWDRPNNVGVVVSINSFNNGTWIMVRERQPNAFRTTGKNIIKDIARKIDLPVIVADSTTPVGEDFGDYVIVKDSLKHRCKSLMGKFLGNLDEDDTEFGIYELRSLSRTCGACVACCIQPEVAELNKPAYTPCPKLKAESALANNCTIYNDRPKCCVDFNCAWLRGAGDLKDRPDKSGIMFDNLQGIPNSLTAKPLWAGADLEERGRILIEKISAERNVPVIVIDSKGGKITRIVGRGLHGGHI